jgi:hypothetical protein
MKSRETLLGGAATLSTTARAQQSERCGALACSPVHNRGHPEVQARVGAFLQGLHELAGASAATALYDLSWLLRLIVRAHDDQSFPLLSS